MAYLDVYIFYRQKALVFLPLKTPICYHGKRQLIKSYNGSSVYADADEE